MDEFSRISDNTARTADELKKINTDGLIITGVTITGGSMTTTEVNSADIENEIISLNGKIDSVINASDNSLSTQLYILKDGTKTPVQLDTIAPYANVPIPVVLTDITGQAVVNVNITDSTLNVDSIIKDKDLNAFSSTSNIAGQRGLDVEVKNASGINAVNIQDGGNTITVDGSVSVSNMINVSNLATSAKQLADNHNVKVNSSTEAITSTSGAIDVNLKSSSGNIPTTIAHISNTSISNVTATQISNASNSCKKVIVTALETNTSWIRIGGSTLTTTSGILLYPTDSIELTISNTNLLYALAGVNGEDITVTYFN